MCGRFARYTPTRLLAAQFGISGHVGEFLPRYNVSPGTAIINIEGRLGSRSLESFWWGWIPRWSKDGKPGPINARGETVAERPMFRAAWRDGQRSIIPADGFYEWRKTAAGKQPFFIRRVDGQPLALAGLYESWNAPDEGPVLSSLIITTEPNGLMADIHNRMPAILPDAEAWEGWLGEPDPRAAQQLLRPAPEGLLEAYPVSSAVNRPANDDPSLIEPV